MRNKTRAPFKRAFSLVELLTVLAITSVLTVLTMLSVSSLRSTALSSSGNQIVDAFAMARQNSISKNVYTIIVIKTQGKGAGDAYCLLELARQDDGTFGAWEAITPWRYLSSGIAFENGQANDTYMNTAVNLPQLLPANFLFQGQQVNLNTMTAFQCYQPDGTLLSGQTSPARLVLRLVQGTVDPSNGALTYQGTTVSGQPANYYDLVFVSNTGVTKIERP
jgi:prepilin-type N-terminal cleavage/methylation domain-containing protein